MWPRQCTSAVSSTAQIHQWLPTSFTHLVHFSLPTLKMKQENFQCIAFKTVPYSERNVERKCVQSLPTANVTAAFTSYVVHCSHFYYASTWQKLYFTMLHPWVHLKGQPTVNFHLFYQTETTLLKVCYRVSLSKNFQRQSCSAINYLSNASTFGRGWPHSHKIWA